MAINFGDVPGWIGAIGTFLGVVAAGIAAWFVYGQLKELRVQNRQQRDVAREQERELAKVREIQAGQLQQIKLDIAERRSAQARQVKVTRRLQSWGVGQDFENGLTLALSVTNDSAAPISNITARYVIGQADPEPGKYAYLPAANRSDKRNALTAKRVVMPVVLIEQGKEAVLIAHPRDEREAKKMRGIVRFTDADKRHWQIDDAGALSELPNRNDW